MGWGCGGVGAWVVVLVVAERRSGSARDVVSSCIVSHPARQHSGGAGRSGGGEAAKCTATSCDGRDTGSVVGAIWGPATKRGTRASCGGVLMW